jgi:hypothetical protein
MERCATLLEQALQPYDVTRMQQVLGMPTVRLYREGQVHLMAGCIKVQGMENWMLTFGVQQGGD